jgi:hypothetical protein
MIFIGPVHKNKTECATIILELSAEWTGKHGLTRSNRIDRFESTCAA